MSKAIKKSHEENRMKKLVLLICVMLVVSLVSGCDIWEGVKWALGLVNYGRIEGTVMDIEGNPVEEATISTDAKIGTRQYEETSTTDSEGKYTLNTVPPGIHDVIM